MTGRSGKSGKMTAAEYLKQLEASPDYEANERTWQEESQQNRRIDKKITRIFFKNS